jgi:hypothetical protein
MDKPNLHDATLLDVVLTWGKTAGVEVRFRDCGPRIVRLRARNARLLSCPHENPWGPSVSVNEIRGPEPRDGDTQRVEIEVQSGDTIVIESQDFEWDLVDGAPG